MIYAEPFSLYGDGDKLHWNWDSISKHLDGISKQSGFGYEDETIIQRGTTFRVIKAEKKGTEIAGGIFWRRGIRVLRKAGIGPTRKMIWKRLQRNR
jgi:hypothetical protein